MCNCKSANNYSGSDVCILDLPEWCDVGRKNRKVGIDCCISDVIKHLWNNEIETLCCCCGHDKANPSVVVGQGASIEKVFKLILEVDKREWTVSRWERIDYSYKKLPRNDYYS